MSDIIRYSNFAQSTITNPVSGEDTLINLENDEIFPDGYFTSVIWNASEGSPLDDSDRELVLLKRVSAGVFEAVRGIEGTAPTAWESGSKIANIVTAGSMELLHDAANSATSITDVHVNSYSMERGDTNIIFHFANEDEESKTVTLPELAPCEGLTFKITSKAFNLWQKVKLTPFAGDIFTHTANAYLDVQNGMTVILLATASGWVLMDFHQSDFSRVKTANNMFNDVSFTDRLIFADGSYGYTDINLPTAPEVYGIPLTIIRIDDTSQTVMVNGNEMVQYESMTFIMENDGTVSMINHYIPEQSGVLSVSTGTNLKGHEKLVLTDAASSSVNIILSSASSAKGRAVTVKKTDSTGNPVLIIPSSGTIDGTGAPQFIYSQWDYVTVASDGTNWFKVG